MFVRQALALVGDRDRPRRAGSRRPGLTRLMESQLFGVTPLDPVTHLAVSHG
jgi:hypothetical protein